MTDTDAPQIEPRLPCLPGFGPGGDTSFLYGAKIVRIGAADFDGDSRLAVEYEKGGARRTVLLGYSDIGLEFVSESLGG